MGDGVSNGCPDTGAHDAAEEVLAAAPWVFGEVMEQAPVGVAVFDRDIRFVAVNERLAKITGLAVDDHIGKRPEQVLSGVAPESYLPSARRALRGEACEAVEVSGELAAGPEVARSWLQSWAPVRSRGGEVVAVLAFVVEISGRERAEQALREHARRVRVRAQALADLAAGMAAATSVERMAVVVAARAAAAAGAEFSNLALLTADGERLRLYHHESLEERIARRWSEVSLQDPVPLVDAVRRREPVFVHGPEENARRYPALVADTEGAGLAATASLPVLDRHDRVLGAMGFAWSQPQRFEPELQSVLRTIAELTGQSLERARLHAGEQRARERAGVLVEATHAIGTPGSTGERLQRLCERLVPRFSDLAVAELPADPGGGMPLAVVHRDPRRRDMLRVLLKLEPHDGPAPPGAARILAGAQPELVPDTSRAQREQRAPDREMLELLAGLGIDSYLGVPLRAGGAVVGALLLGQSHSGRRFGAEDLAFAADLGERVGLILDNVRLAEAEHEIAVELQQRLLPAALAAPPGTALAARYRAGHARLAVGGDWYEVVGRADGRAVIAVGDIVGHGPRAAAAMGQIRSALTATASAADGPAALLDRLDDFAARTPDVQCSTVCVAFLDPRDGDLRYACAGHPPPALLRPDGRAELLDGGRSWPLAAAADEEDDEALVRTEDQATMPVAGRLVLYTDGLIERRDASLDEGFARLITALQDHSHETTEQLCDAVLADMLPEASGQDDAALLCIQRTRADDSGDPAATAPTRA